MTFAEARAARTTMKKAHRARREAELGAKQRALPDKRYGVILADPPWRFQPYSRETGLDRSADNHYPTSPLAEIKALDVNSIAAADCVLFLWATAPMLPHGDRGHGGVGLYLQNLRCVEQGQDRNWILVSQQARDFVGRNAGACSGPRHGNAVAVAS